MEQKSQFRTYEIRSAYGLWVLVAFRVEPQATSLSIYNKDPKHISTCLATFNKKTRENNTLKLVAPTNRTCPIKPLRTSMRSPTLNFDVAAEIFGVVAAKSRDMVLSTFCHEA
jgi:hypothetical protein